MIILSVLKYHRKNNFLIRYYKWTFPQRPPWGQKKVAVLERFKQESFAFSFTSILWHIIFDRDPDSPFIIDGDLPPHFAGLIIRWWCWYSTWDICCGTTRSTELVGDSQTHLMMDPYSKQQRWRQRRNRHLTEWIRAASIFIALAPSHSIREMLAFFSGIGY